MNLLKRTIQWLIVTGITYPMGIFYSILLARWLGPVDRGEFAVFLTIVNTLAGLLSVGMGILGRVDVSRTPSNFKVVHANLLWFSLFVGTLVSFFLPIATHILPSLTEFKTIEIVLIPFIVMSLVYSGFSELIFQGAGWFRRLNFLRIIKAVLDLALLICLVILLKLGLSGAIICFTISVLLLFGVRLVISIKSGGPIVGVDWKLLRRFLRDGWKLLLAAQAVAFQVSATILLLRYYHPGASVGFFAVAMGLAMQIGIFWGTFGVIASDRIASSDRTDSEGIVLFLNRTLLWGAILILIVLYPICNLIVSVLYGDEFRPAGQLLFVLAAGILMATITEVNSQYLIAQPDGVEKCLKMNLLNLFVCIFLIFLLIPVYGALGAAVALGIVYVLNALAYQFAVKQMLGCKWHELFLVTSSDFAKLSLSIRRIRSQLAIG